MKPIIVRNCRIGEGKPKIIVPITGIRREEILEEASYFVSDRIPFDVVEWRIDWFKQGTDAAAVSETAEKLRQILGEAPLLITFRTKKEGGEASISPEDYTALLKNICASGQADLIDVEIFTGDSFVSSIIEAAHSNGVAVVASNHDFQKTPPKDELVARLRKMRAMGADIPKIAVMPTCNKDVLTLLEATGEMALTCDCPLITMSMSRTGVISRLVGESFGSAMTFGAAAKASAPGQIPVRELEQALEIIHKGLI